MRIVYRHGLGTDRRAARSELGKHVARDGALSRNAVRLEVRASAASRPGWAAVLARAELRDGRVLRVDVVDPEPQVALRLAVERMGRAIARALAAAPHVAGAPEPHFGFLEE